MRQCDRSTYGHEVLEPRIDDSDRFFVGRWWRGEVFALLNRNRQRLGCWNHVAGALGIAVITWTMRRSRAWAFVWVLFLWSEILCVNQQHSHWEDLVGIKTGGLIIDEWVNSPNMMPSKLDRAFSSNFVASSSRSPLYGAWFWFFCCFDILFFYEPVASMHNNFHDFSLSRQIRRLNSNVSQDSGMFLI